MSIRSETEKIISTLINDNTDVLVYYAYEHPLDATDAKIIIDNTKKSNQKTKNLIFFLRSSGGYQDPAIEIINHLEKTYNHVTIIAPGSTKSAATLICSLANKLLTHSETILGPIDPRPSNPSHKLDELEKKLNDTDYSTIISKYRNIWKNQMRSVSTYDLIDLQVDLFNMAEKKSRDLQSDISNQAEYQKHENLRRNFQDLINTSHAELRYIKYFAIKSLLKNRFGDLDILMPILEKWCKGNTDDDARKKAIDKLKIKWSAPTSAGSDSASVMYDIVKEIVMNKYLVSKEYASFHDKGYIFNTNEYACDRLKRDIELLKTLFLTTQMDRTNPQHNCYLSLHESLMNIIKFKNKKRIIIFRNTEKSPLIKTI